MVSYSVAAGPGNPTLSGSGATRTFSYTPAAVGNLVLFMAAWQPSTATLSNFSCSNMNLFYYSSSTPDTGQVPSGTTLAWQGYAGVPVSTTTQTATYTLSATITFLNIDYIEIAPQAGIESPGNWYWNQLQHVGSSSSTITFDNPPRSTQDGFYVGWCYVGSPPASAGSSSGFTYFYDSTTEDQWAYNMGYKSSAVVPTSTQNSAATFFTRSGIIYYLQEWIPSPLGYGSF